MKYSIKKLEKQLYPLTATNEYLDQWAKHFGGISRKRRETDKKFRGRMLEEHGKQHIAMLVANGSGIDITHKIADKIKNKRVKI